jgi:hypothetical protein
MNWAVDFSHAPSPPGVGWALLGAGILALAASIAVEAHFVAAKDAADRELLAQLDLERLRRQPMKVVPPTAGEIRVREAVAESRGPWLATLRAIETTTQDPVYLRSMTVEPSTAVIKLEAEAPSFADALSYAKALDEEALLHPALLTSHEAVADTTTGKNVVRFNVVTQWNSR